MHLLQELVQEEQLLGVGRFLKSKNSKFELVLADPKGSILKELIDTGNLSDNVGSVVEGIEKIFVLHYWIQV